MRNVFSRIICATMVMAMGMVTPLFAFGAETFPARAVRLIVPFPAGGPTDVLARLVAQKLSEGWKQPVIVDNRPGAGANIGAEFVAKAPADGYTLLMTTSVIVVAPSLYPKLSYDHLRDFAPVVNVASAPAMLLVHPSIQATSVKELIALAKANPGRLNFASPGSGTPLHLSAELFKVMADIQIEHIPYKGSAPALTDLIGGQVSIMFDSPVSGLRYVRSGALRALGVSSLQRLAVAPNIPTIAETVPGYDASFWYGVFAPAGTASEIVTRINADVVKLLALPEVRERIEALGVVPVGNTLAQFSAQARSDMAKWAQIVKVSGAKID